MNNKGQVRGLLAYVFTQFHTRIQAIRSDQGVEFEMHDFYSSLGIIHQQSCVYTPQQNSVVERKHRHLLEVAHALRFQASLPIKFWSSCVLTAAYLINRLPTPNLSKHSPSNELLYGSKPNYSHLRTLGCLCHASSHHINRHKFDSRAQRCIFIGYPAHMKAYRLYNLDTPGMWCFMKPHFHVPLLPLLIMIPFFHPFTDHSLP